VKLSVPRKEERTWTCVEVAAHHNHGKPGSIRFTPAEGTKVAPGTPPKWLDPKETPKAVFVSTAAPKEGVNPVSGSKIFKAKVVTNQDPIYVDQDDFDVWKRTADSPVTEGGEKISTSIYLYVSAASTWACVFHPSNHGARWDAFVTFLASLALAGCAIANVYFSHKVDTNVWIFRIALGVLFVTLAAGGFKLYRDLRKVAG
jgi:hypothetical protein